MENLQNHSANIVANLKALWGEDGIKDSDNLCKTTDSETDEVGLEYWHKPASDDSKFAEDEDELKASGMEVPEGALRIKGYASMFGNVDDQNDMIVKGAFKEAIAHLKSAKRGRCGMYYNHNMWSSTPIGVWHSFREDGKGLFVRGFIDPTAASGMGEQVIKGISYGALADLSVTGRAKKHEYNAEGVRVIKEFALKEISVVWWAANQRAQLKAAMSGGGIDKSKESCFNISQLKQATAAAFNRLTESQHKE